MCVWYEDIYFVTDWSLSLKSHYSCFRTVLINFWHDLPPLWFPTYWLMSRHSTLQNWHKFLTGMISIFVPWDLTRLLLFSVHLIKLIAVNLTKSNPRGWEWSVKSSQPHHLSPWETLVRSWWGCNNHLTVPPHYWPGSSHTLSSAILTRITQKFADSSQK